MAIAEKPERIVFGVFEVDVQSGEIWKAGYRVRLQGLPFRVLCALLARPGQVVSRSELQVQVWGPDTNVDFERALAVAVNKIREALADSADNPRFVETLAKRGYRFIAPVSTSGPQIVVQPAPAAPQVEQAPAPFTPASTLIGESYSASKQPADGTRGPALGGSRLSRRELGLFCAVVLLLALASALLLRGAPAPPPPLQVDQITHDSPISAGSLGMESLLTLVADGDRIVTSVSVDGKPQLAAISISTGEVRPLVVPAELSSATVCDISSDGTRLLLRSHLTSASEQPLWIVPTVGGSALRVGNIVAQDATWMPDGTTILFSRGNDLMLVRPDGGGMMRYASLPGRAFALRWSPDGALLRFTLMDPSTHTSSIWQMAGGKPVAHPLFRGALDETFECCGTWTGDGKEYLFIRSDHAGSNVWAAAGRGAAGALTQLTNGPLRYSSPVAARLSHRVFFYGSDQPSGLQRYGGPKLGFQPARSFLADANRVDFSRDGRWVAWTDTTARLWRARASDGSEKMQLTANGLEVFLAQWSPDGTKLAMMARRPGQAWQIYILGADGGKPERLLDDARNTADPSWSADGRSIVYGREPDALGKEAGPRALEIFDLQSRTTVKLPESEGLFSPRWSPDGRWIAALTLDQKKVMLFNLQDHRWRTLAETSAADPVWSSDSQAIYIHAFMSEREPILRISVPDGEVHTAAGTGDFHAGEPANYFFGGLTPENAPLVRARVGTGDLYLLDLNRQ